MKDRITKLWEESYLFNRDLGGIPFDGRLDLYSGGGYVSVLGNTAKSTKKILADLKQHDWVDRYTKAVFVEFTVSCVVLFVFIRTILLMIIPLNQPISFLLFAYPSYSSLALSQPHGSYIPSNTLIYHTIHIGLQRQH